MEWQLEPGEVISRKELHDDYGGGRQGGISPSKQSPNVLIFSDRKSGARHGYIYDGDDPNDPTLFHYTGAGQRGRQVMRSGNRALLEHEEQGRALRLFKGVRGKVRYVGEYKLDSNPFDLKSAPGSGNAPQRQVIVFRLRPVAASVNRRRVPPRGSSYRRAARTPTTPSELPFTRDPNAIDRALTAHADIQDGLNDFLSSNSAHTWSPEPGDPDFDLAWTLRGTTFVAEVKSLTDANEENQLRLGLGQVLDYQALMGRETVGVRAVLAVEREPGDGRWMSLCERHAVSLVWPGTFEALLNPTLVAAI